MQVNPKYEDFEEETDNRDDSREEEYDDEDYSEFEHSFWPTKEDMEMDCE